MTTLSEHLSFSERVHEYIAMRSDGGFDVSRVAKLAAFFSTITTAPLRWARGTARPHPLLQKQVLEYIAANGGRVS